jgi:hypothetical protein
MRAICLTALGLAGLGGGAETAAAAGDRQKAQRLGGSNRQTARGGWRVVAARVDRRSGWARLRFVTDEGLRGQVRVAAGFRGTTVNGYPVETGRSPIC